MNKRTKIHLFFIAFIILILAAFYLIAHIAYGQVINPLDQWISSSSPSTAITQRVYGKALKLSGQSTGCAQFDSGGVLTSTGTICGGGAGTVNSGTTGQVPYYAANGTALTATSTLFISTGSNVGIGTTSPLQKLHISGGNLAIDSASNPVTAYYTSSTLRGMSGIATGIGNLDSAAVANDMVIRTEGGAMRFNTNAGVGTSAFTILGGNGNIGIGTTSPLSKLAVSGGASIGADYNIAAPTNSLIVEGKIGIGVTNPTDFLNIITTAGTNGGVTVKSGGASSVPWFSTVIGSQQSYWAMAQNAGTFFSNSATGDMIFRTAQNTNILLGADNGLGTAASVLTILGSNGNIGINTTAPKSKLDVSGGISVGSYAGANASPLNGMIVSGNVGIGTNNPNAPLEISGGGLYLSNYNLGVLVPGGGSLGFYLRGPNNVSPFGFSAAGTGNIGVTAPLFFYSWVGNDAKKLGFSTYDGSVTNQFLTFDYSTTDIGIGTTSPNVRLDVLGTESSGGTNVLTIDTSAKNFSAGGPLLNFAQGSQPTAALYSSTGSGNANPFLAFEVSPNSTTPVEVGRFDKNGNFGIGTTTPFSKFQVTSGANATTTVNFGEVGVNTSKACFNTKNTAGSDISFYFVGTAMVVEGNLCK